MGSKSMCNNSTVCMFTLLYKGFASVGMRTFVGNVESHSTMSVTRASYGTLDTQALRSALRAGGVSELVFERTNMTNNLRASRRCSDIVGARHNDGSRLLK
jgi:hypothetical protein